MEALIIYLENLIHLSDADKRLIKEYFEEHTYTKKEFLLQEGKVCEYYYFILQGCVRMYKIDSKDNTHIIHFAVENNWAADLDSFYNLKPSLFYIEALENTMVLRISLNNLIFLYQNITKLDRIFRILIEQYAVRLQQRILQYISGTVEEKYLAFTNDYPHLLNRLPQVQIAAYLGISSESISRIRRKIAFNNLN